MIQQRQVSNIESRPVGALITWPRRYRLLTDVYFLGRAGSLARYFATTSGIRPGDHAIDIGCGPGRLANELARQAGPQGRALGVDPSPQMIAYATAHAAPNCAFDLGAAQSLPYPDASFDVATSTFAMHHIAEPERKTALAAVFRVLRPGGRLLLADTHPTTGLRGLAIRAMAQLAAHRAGGGHGHSHDGDEAGDPLSAVDIRRYRDMLAAVGFTAIEFRTGPFATGILTAVKPD
ncbi:methyltransferase domain-containing protein [Nocardia aurantiaca]|uniref:Methyltransferase domain-containing protein n=1 Tax=Nocardia aurantiaca TaxID=2675850 RepID=A0A6I3KUT0_9NOCA|nr:methyltransferase domain-containing protein [Nocardia aurantiaca]MTE11794.1 methyltransferase domain-containing protein [Nocardia aurantiaca]